MKTTTWVLLATIVALSGGCGYATSDDDENQAAAGSSAESGAAGGESMAGSGESGAGTGASGEFVAGAGGIGGGPDSESDAYAVDVDAIPCEELRDAYYDFVDANRDCENDADCTIFYPAGYTDCGPLDAIGDKDGEAINPSAVDTAQRFVDRYESPDCAHLDHMGVYDGTPKVSASCDERGLCIGNPGQPCGMGMAR